MFEEETIFEKSEIDLSLRGNIWIQWQKAISFDKKYSYNLIEETILSRKQYWGRSIMIWKAISSREVVDLKSYERGMKKYLEIIKAVKMIMIFKVVKDNQSIMDVSAW